MGSGKVTTDAITKGKDVFVLFMLQCVFVNIDEAVLITKTGVSDERLRFRRRIDACSEEWLLNNLSIVNVFENSNLLIVFIFLDFNHLPSEHHIDVPLVTFIKSYLISVGELVDFLVRGPEL